MDELETKLKEIGWSFHGGQHQEESGKLFIQGRLGVLLIEGSIWISIGTIPILHTSLTADMWIEFPENCGPLTEGEWYIVIKTATIIRGLKGRENFNR